MTAFNLAINERVRRVRRRAIGIAAVAATVASASIVVDATGAEVAASAPASSDRWIEEEGQFPAFVQTNTVVMGPFKSLHAEVSGGRLRVYWQPGSMDSTARLVLYASADGSGHWPARDWRSITMSPEAARWSATLPVLSLDVPVAYFATASAGTNLQTSPMRVVHPRQAGLKAPTERFWGYVEGFEDGIEGWRLMADRPEEGSIRQSPMSHHGRASLQVSLPEGKRSVTLATTRLRGWHLVETRAQGIRVWLRNSDGMGRARISLFANAFTPRASSVTEPEDIALDEQWRKVDLRFAVSPKFSLAELDLVAIEFIAAGPVEFYVDDLEVLGPWKPEFE